MIGDGDSLVVRRKRIAHNILLSRTALRLTQRDLAFELGVSPDRMGRIERGESSLNFEEAPTLCEILGFENLDALYDAEYTHRF